MRNVNIGTLKNQLSAYLQLVQQGEEVVVRDRNRPVARIVPFKPETAREFTEEELYLASIGVLTLPESAEPMDWDAFWKLPRPEVSESAVREAIEWAKGE